MGADDYSTVIHFFASSLLLLMFVVSELILIAVCRSGTSPLVVRIRRASASRLLVTFSL